MVGALGDDVYAGMTLENLDAQGVDATHVARVPGSSGVAPIWVEPDGTNRIIVVPGANDAVDPDAAAAAIRSHGPRSTWSIGQLEIPQARDGRGLPGGARARRGDDPQPGPGGAAGPAPPRRRGLAHPERDRVRDPRRHRSRSTRSDDSGASSPSRGGSGRGWW